MVTNIVEDTRKVWEQNELPADLAWINDLSPLNQRLFFAALQYKWGRYCVTGDTRSLSEFLEDWEATAEIDHDPELSAYLLEPKDESEFDEWKAVS